MNGLPKSPSEQVESDVQPLIGAAVVSVPLPARADLSDWVDLMETVEALCPKWPPRPAEHFGLFKL